MSDTTNWYGFTVPNEHHEIAAGMAKYLRYKIGRTTNDEKRAGYIAELAALEATYDDAVDEFLAEYDPAGTPNQEDQA